MTDHSHNWYDETTTRKKINDSPDNIDAIQASFKEAYPTKECPLKKEDMVVEQNKYMRSLEETVIKLCYESIKKQAEDDEWIRKSIENMESNIRALKTTTKNLQEKAYELNQTVLTNTEKKNNNGPCRTRKTVCMIRNPEKVNKMKAREDEGDMDAGSVHDMEKIVREEEQDYDVPLHDGVMQPLTPLIVHITPPDDDYVASATSPTLDKQLNEFRKECSDITRIVKKANCNQVNDVKDLSDIKKYDCETFIQKLLHQVSQSSHETGKIKREMKSHQRYGSNLSFPYPVANLHHHGVHCYSLLHLIASEGRNTLLLGK
ncbi:hypothetical protein Tco_0837989 [Tanacetum coccineum]